MSLEPLTLDHSTARLGRLAVEAILCPGDEVVRER
jgi:hypothetical protein